MADKRTIIAIDAFFKRRYINFQQIILTIKWFAIANLLNVSIYAGKWLTLALTSYASSVADVANPRSRHLSSVTTSYCV